MNSARKGNAKESKTVAILEDEGWVVASRRHIGGCADLLAVKKGERPRLIEVKVSSTPYMNFRGPDREAMSLYALEHDLDAELAWWPHRARTHTIIGSADWPTPPRAG